MYESNNESDVHTLCGSRIFKYNVSYVQFHVKSYFSENLLQNVTRKLSDVIDPIYLMFLEIFYDPSAADFLRFRNLQTLLRVLFIS